MAAPGPSRSRAPRVPIGLQSSSPTPDHSHANLLLNPIESINEDSTAITGIPSIAQPSRPYKDLYFQSKTDSDTRRGARALRRTLKSFEQDVIREMQYGTHQIQVEKVYEVVKSLGEANAPIFDTARKLVLNIIKKIPGFHRSMINKFEEDLDLNYWPQIQEHIKEVAETRKQLKTLDEKMDNYSTTIENLQIELSDINENYDQQLEKYNADTQELLARLDDAQKAEAELKTMATDYQITIQKHQSDIIPKLQRNNDELTVKIQQGNQDLSELQTRLDAATTTAVERDRKIQELEEESDTYDAELNELRRFITGLTKDKHALAGIETSHNELVKQLGSLKERISKELDRDNKLRDQIFVSVESTFESLEGRMNDDLSGAVRQVLKVLENLVVGQGEDPGDNLLGMLDVVQNLTLQTRDLRVALKTFTLAISSQITSFEKQITTYDAKVKQLEQDIAGHLANIKQTEFNSDEKLKAKDDQHRKELSQLASTHMEKIKALEEQHSACAQDISKLQNEIDQKETARQLLEAQYRQLRENGDAELKKLRDENVQHVNDIKAKTDSLNDLNTSFNAVQTERDQLKTAEQEFIQAGTKLKALKNQSQQDTERINQLNKDLAEEQSQRRQLEAETKTLKEGTVTADTAHAAELQSIKAELNNTKTDKNTVQDKHDEMERRYNLSEQERKAFEIQVQQLTSDNRTLQLRVDSLQGPAQETDRLRTEALNNQRSYSEAKTALQGQIDEVEVAKTGLVAQLNASKVAAIEADGRLKDAEDKLISLKELSDRWKEVVLRYVADQPDWSLHKDNFAIETVFRQFHDIDTAGFLQIGCLTQFCNLIQEPRRKVQVIEPVVALLKVWYECKATPMGPSYGLVLSLAEGMNRITEPHFVAFFIAVIIDAVSCRWKLCEGDHGNWSPDKCMAWMRLVEILIIHHDGQRQRLNTPEIDLSQKLLGTDFVTGASDSILVTPLFKYLKGLMGIEPKISLAENVVKHASTLTSILPDNLVDARIIPSGDDLILATKAGNVRVLASNEYALVLDTPQLYRLVINNYPRAMVSSEAVFPSSDGQLIESLMLQAFVRGLYNNVGFTRLGDQ